jgi:hypothetical protein
VGDPEAIGQRHAQLSELDRRQSPFAYERATRFFGDVVDRVLAGKATTAFGFIAAEVDVKRGF